MVKQLQAVTTAPADLGIRGFGLIAGWRRRRALKRERELADAELRTSDFTSPRTAWRARELTVPRNRVALARAVDRLLRAADAHYLPGATPLNRRAVREHARALRELALRLSDLERPVSARGMLLIEDLLTDGCGPLYVSYRAIELRDVLARAGHALELVR
jgi:hypothetical protein